MTDLRTLCLTCGITINAKHDTKLFEELNYHLVILIEDITDLWVSKLFYFPVFESLVLQEQITD